MLPTLSPAAGRANGACAGASGTTVPLFGSVRRGAAAGSGRYSSSHPAVGRPR
jgi:hypothetical protein